jgi:hypothetical protein
MTYDTWLLLLLAPTMWWLVAMVRAAVAVRERAVEATDWDAG